MKVILAQEPQFFCAIFNKHPANHISNRPFQLVHFVFPFQTT